MNIYRIASRVAALSQPLSERYDYGINSDDSLPRGESHCECGSDKCGSDKCGSDKCGSDKCGCGDKNQ